MAETAIDRVYEEYRDASEFLLSRGEISLGSAIDATARKALLLAASSYFESRITTDVLAFCREVCGANPLVPALVLNKAVTRQYHTWFQWEGNTATSFFSLFGPEFKNHMNELIKREDDLRAAVEDFLEMGRDRNRLVHEDFATFPLEKTTNEIYSQYKSALGFADRIIFELTNCSRKFSVADRTVNEPGPDGKSAG